MKNIPRFLSAIICGLLLVSSAFANNKQLAVSGTAQAVLTTIDPRTKVLIIQNPSTSTGSVSVSLDGSAPTATVGIIVPAGQQLILCYSGASGSGAQFVPKVILVSGAATINISTDTPYSTN